MKLLAIEASRGFAALLVVAMHTSDLLAGKPFLGAYAFDGLFRFGHAGVDFFFVLSGFVITYVHAGDIGQPGAFKAYAWKRLLRIYPTYWAALAVMGALLLVSPTSDHAEQHLGVVVSSVLLLPWPAEPLLGVAWSLKHELMFYGLFGLLLLHRSAGRWVLGVWGALALFNVGRLWLTGEPQFGGLWNSLVFRIFNTEFFFGIAVAALIRRGWIGRPLLLASAGLVLFLGSGLYESWGPPRPAEWPPRHLAYATGAALILYGLAGAELKGRLQTPGPLVTLGAASYSVYLVHVIALLFVRQAIRMLRPAVELPVEVWFLVGMVFAVSAGVIFWRRIERPLLHRFHRPLRPEPAPALS